MLSGANVVAPGQLGFVEVEFLDQVHLLHQEEGHAGERAPTGLCLEVKSVVLPVLGGAEQAGQLEGGGEG